MSAILTFEAETHTYRLNGKVCPSVTQVLDGYQDFSDVPPDRLEAAREFGSHVHEACNLLVRDELDWQKLDPALVPYIEGAQKFLTDSGVIVIASERRVSSEKRQVAGTLDIVGLFRRDECVIDWKSPVRMPRTIGIQTAAYELLYREEVGGRQRKRYGVQLRPGDYRMYPCRDARDYTLFQSMVNIHSWLHGEHTR